MAEYHTEYDESSDVYEDDIIQESKKIADPYLLPIPPDDEPVVLNEEQTDYYRKRDLIQKIKVVVAFDLFSSASGPLTQYNEMNTVNRLRFKKQCSRLFYSCVDSLRDEEYITERFNEIVSDGILASGASHESLLVQRNPYI